MTLFTMPKFNAFVSSMKGVTLVDQWESRVAKVGGKVFTLLSQTSEGTMHIVFKCSEDSFMLLTEIDGIRQAPYFAKRSWVSVSDTADLSEGDLKKYMQQSHMIIAGGLTKKLRQELGIVP